MHLFSGPTVPSTGVLCSRSNPLSTRPPHFPSILSSAAPARTHSRSTVPPILRFHAAPILTPGDTLLSLCGCFRPGSRIRDTASPSRTSPLPACRVPSPVARSFPLSKSPSSTPARTSSALLLCWSPLLEHPSGHPLSNWPRASPRRQEKGDSASQLSRAPAAPLACQPGLPGAPSPRPTAQQPHKLTCGSPGGGCGERRRAPRLRVRPSRRGWAARRRRCAPAAAR